MHTRIPVKLFCKCCAVSHTQWEYASMCGADFMYRCRLCRHAFTTRETRLAIADHRIRMVEMYTKGAK